MIGASTGGTAVTALAAQVRMKRLEAIILISPNFAPADRTANILTWPGGLKLAELIIGKERQWEAHNPQHAHYWTTRYPTCALLPMMELVKLTARLNLDAVSPPLQVIYAPGDRVVSPRAIVRTFAAIGAERKELVPFTRSQDPSQHILAGDILSPGTTAEVSDMIRKFIRNS
jgi:alpha-beta hydrolase superfamily lysophospholipase